MGNQRKRNVKATQWNFGIGGNMSFKAFYREDIRNAVEGLQKTNEGQNDILSLCNDPRLIILLSAYNAGYNNALSSLEIIFGCTIRYQVDKQKLLSLLSQLDSPTTLES